MKQHTPYHILLVLALVSAGLTLYLNLSLNGSYPITVEYRLPEVPQENRQVLTQKQPFYSEKAEDEPEQENPLESVRFPLDLNSATKEELTFIPQVGDVLSQRIVQYRDYLGGYTALEQLRDIEGIGSRTYENLIVYLYIEEWGGAENTVEKTDEK